MSGMKTIHRDGHDPSGTQRMNVVPTEDEPSMLDRKPASQGHEDDDEDSEDPSSFSSQGDSDSYPDEPSQQSNSKQSNDGKGKGVLPLVKKQTRTKGGTAESVEQTKKRKLEEEEINNDLELYN